MVLLHRASLSEDVRGLVLATILEHHRKFLVEGGHRLLFSRPSLRCKEKAIIPVAQIKRRGDAEPVCARRHHDPADRLLASLRWAASGLRRGLRSSERQDVSESRCLPSGRGALVPKQEFGNETNARKESKECLHGHDP